MRPTWKELGKNSNHGQCMPHGAWGVSGSAELGAQDE
jgi:hypothetical protein